MKFLKDCECLKYIFLDKRFIVAYNIIFCELMYLLLGCTGLAPIKRFVCTSAMFILTKVLDVFSEILKEVIVGAAVSTILEHFKH